MPIQKKTKSTRAKLTVVKKSAPARKPVERKTTTRKTKVSKHVLSNSSTNTSSAMPSAVKTYAKNPRLWVGVGVVVLAGLLFFYKGLVIAATVNGQPISRIAVISQLEKQGGKQALSNLIVENLVRQDAQKKHITVSQSDIDGQLNKIEGQLKGQGVTLDDALAAQGLTRADLTSQLQLQGMLTKLVGPVQVSDADVQSYIDKNKDTLPTNLSDADLKAQVKSQLEQQALQQKEQAYVANLQKQAKISYFVNY